MSFLLSEQFANDRSHRCVKICRHILQNWRVANSFNHSITCPEVIAGRTIEDISQLTFTLTVAHTNYDLPLIDLLAVFDLVVKEIHPELAPPAEANGTKVYALRTAYTEEAAWSLLSQIGVMPLVNG